MILQNKIVKRLKRRIRELERLDKKIWGYDYKFNKDIKIVEVREIFGLDEEDKVIFGETFKGRELKKFLKVRLKK